VSFLNIKRRELSIDTVYTYSASQCMMSAIVRRDSSLQTEIDTNEIFDETPGESRLFRGILTLF